MSDDRLAHAEAILRAAAGNRVRSGYPLAPLTSFRLGGPASLYLEAVQTTAETELRVYEEVTKTPTKRRKKSGTG